MEEIMIEFFELDAFIKVDYASLPLSEMKSQRVFDNRIQDENCITAISADYPCQEFPHKK